MNHPYPALQPPAWPPLPTGWYLLALQSFDRRTSPHSQQDYMEGCFEVLSGPHRGAVTSIPVGLWIGHLGSLRRLQAWARAVRLEGAVNVASDEALESAFVRKAFKARLGVNVNASGRVNCLEWVAQAHEYSDEDREAIAAWEARR